MQSTNEELEASKEELQSVNEELQTVNAELNGKIDALDRAHSDLRNLFDSTDVATVFLDKQLEIRSFTPAVSKIFNILATDRGRPITDLSSRLDLAGFSEDIAQVFAYGERIERRVEDNDQNSHYLVRLAPYRDGSHKIEGVVVTFIDVTTLTRSEATQKMLIGELQHRTRNLLSIVQSISEQTLGKGGTLDGLRTRLAALGRVQSLLGGAMDESVDLEDIVRLELQATGAVEDRISVAGPAVQLGFDLVQTFGLALHELATNAVKYGALGNETGHLSVIWAISYDEQNTQVLTLRWQESGLKNVMVPIRRGFGLTLIEKALKFTLHAHVEVKFSPCGLCCDVVIPLPPRTIEVAKPEP
ncbi:PAS domain-containing protein [Gluconobacter sp. P1D12_c]|uniref:PAS domain-containing protein n=1 Tax=Gluconobacter sp. P1D12_c TaxID=2762614 RepID=UPI001C053F31|nr:PAS domain-containing protein [Gluconobacter sp. P1D12_c]